MCYSWFSFDEAITFKLCFSIHSQTLLSKSNLWIFYLRKVSNQYHNLYRDTVYDGSHLTFPGMTPDFQMRRHQANFVRRVERQKASFAAHRVGYGKTATMIASGMELKRKAWLTRLCM